MATVTKTMTRVQSDAGGASGSFGTSPTAAITSFKSAGGTDQSGNLVVTFPDAAHGTIAFAYDPVANGQAGGFVTITLGTSPSGGFAPGDLIVPVSFAVQDGLAVNASGTVQADMEAIKNTALGSETFGPGCMAAALSLSLNQSTNVPPLVATVTSVATAEGFPYGLVVSGGIAATVQPLGWTSDSNVLYGASNALLVSNGTNWLLVANHTWVGPASTGSPVGTYTVSGQPNITIAAASPPAVTVTTTETTVIS